MILLWHLGGTKRPGIEPIVEKRKKEKKNETNPSKNYQVSTTYLCMKSIISYLMTYAEYIKLPISKTCCRMMQKYIHTYSTTLGSTFTKYFAKQVLFVLQKFMTTNVL